MNKRKTFNEKRKKNTDTIHEHFNGNFFLSLKWLTRTRTMIKLYSLNIISRILNSFMLRSPFTRQNKNSSFTKPQNN